MAAGKNWMANERLKLIVHADGTFNLLDKSTGQTYRRLHYFEDSGQDRSTMIPWYSVPPKRDRVLDSRGGKAVVKLIRNTSLVTQIRVACGFRVPASVDTKCPVCDGSKHRYGRRSDTHVRLSIVSVLTLRKGSRRVDVETTLCNRARDHRLRVMFPTDVAARESFADAPYDVVRRPISIPGLDKCHETKTLGRVSTNPMLRFVDVASAKRSLAMLVDGLPEYELLDDARRTVAITLLRAYANVLAEPDCPEAPIHGSQCLGQHTFRYAVYPHTGRWEKAGVLTEAIAQNLPLKTIQTIRSGAGSQAPRESFVELSDRSLVITALKKSQDGDDLVLRVLNPTGRTVKAGVRCGFDVRRAWLTDMLEQSLPNGRLKVEQRSRIALDVRPKKVVTVRIACSAPHSGPG